MTNFPGKPLSSCHFRLAGAFSGLALFLSVPVTAQQFSADTADQGPVDLLATIQDNRSTSSDDTASGTQCAHIANATKHYDISVTKTVPASEL